ncbi:MAG: GspE/PulE family protein [bacterium]|nr:GspE/PulE family protein [bacterium]
MPKVSTVEKRRTLEQFLVEKGDLTKKQLSGIEIGQATNREGVEAALFKILGEEKFTRAKADFFHLPYVDLRTQSISKDAYTVVGKDISENYKFLPFAKENDLVKIALTNPADLRALEALEFLAQKNKYRIELYLTSPSSYNEAVVKGRTISSEVSEALQAIQKKEKETQLTSQGAEAAIVARKISPEAPITKIVDVIIKHAFTARASDIHIEPQENDLRIRYRVDGILYSSLIVPKIVHPAIVSRIKILSNLKIDEQRLPQDGRFHMDIEEHSIDFRVSTLPTVNGEKVVMRLLDKSSGVSSLAELGLTGMKLRRLKENIIKAHGMLLVTGPTGSGKSTTLYAVLTILNKIGVNIVTLEDPVEYFVNGVNQAQVNPDIGLTFASGLRSILRQDPNIIMVGEIRDRETAELAVHSALTGHLVFSTLHTNDAVGAIPRLLDMGIEAFLLTASVNAVMAQRLVRKICRDCRKEISVQEEVKKMFAQELKGIPKEEAEGVDLSKIKLYAGAGCKSCGDSGYKGRLAIFEVLPLSDKLKEQILGRESAAKLGETARVEGMITMKQDGLIKALKGLITLEEVIRVTKE